MNDHDDLERRLRGLLRDSLDPELGPDPTWTQSPAARRVAEAERRARRSRPLRVLGIAALIGLAGGAAVLGGAPDGPTPPPQVDLPGSDGWIAFTGYEADPTTTDTSDFDIWFVALGQDARRVLGSETDSVDELCPAFSADGLQLAYARSDEASGTVELAIADVSPDGAVTNRLTMPLENGGPPPCAVWSPEGTHLAFAVPLTSPTNPERSAEGSEVRILNVEDETVTVLPNLLATDLEWSPDGDVLAIASGEEWERLGDALRDGRIHLYEQSSAEMRTLEDTLGANQLTWSPDGRSIAFTAMAESQEDDSLTLRVIDIETEEQRQLAGRFGVLHGIGPVWSPDGKTIAFQRGCRLGMCGEGSDIILVDANAASGPEGNADEVDISTFRTASDGTERDLDPYRVTWSPDGEYLLTLAWGDATQGDLGAFLVAVSVDRQRSDVLLYGADSSETRGIVPYEGYDRTSYAPIQTWAVPSD